MRITNNTLYIFEYYAEAIMSCTVLHQRRITASLRNLIAYARVSRHRMIFLPWCLWTCGSSKHRRTSTRMTEATRSWHFAAWLLGTTVAVPCSVSRRACFFRVSRFSAPVPDTDHGRTSALVAELPLLSLTSLPQHETKNARTPATENAVPTPRDTTNAHVPAAETILPEAGRARNASTIMRSRRVIPLTSLPAGGAPNSPDQGRMNASKSARFRTSGVRRVRKKSEKKLKPR